MRPKEHPPAAPSPTWTIFHTEASLGWGGQEIRILTESLGMKGRGHRVVVIAQDDSTILKRAGDAGLETICLSFRKKDYLSTFMGLLRAIRTFRPDVVNTHSSKDSWLATIASRVSRTRPAVVRTRHISTPVSTSMTSGLIYRSLPDKIVTTAEAIGSELVRRNRVPPEKLVAIPTGIDPCAYDPGASYPDLRRELGLEPGTPLVGMVSVLRSWKGHDYFIEAAELVAGRIPGLRFVIAGDGPRREAVKKAIDEKGLADTVLMIGHRDDVPAVLSSLDVFVQPSYANEGIPQSVIQAMAMKVPVVATDLKPFKELVTDGETGLLVPPKDPERLAGAIERIAGDRGLGRRLSEKAHAMVLERFTIERMLDATEELYMELTSPGRAGTG